MKRLKKRAWETIELYHHTSSQLFMKMVEEGYITPGGYNNNISSGGHVKILELANNENPGELYDLTEIDKFKDNIDETIIISQDLLSYLEQRKEKNPNGWDEENVEVVKTMPSGNENGVYLTRDFNDESGYAYEAVTNNSDSSLPNFSTSLKVEVQTDALSPDYDDLKYFNKELNHYSETPLWKQSLDTIEQVVHNGPIDINNITGVMIKGDYFSMGDNVSRNDFIQYIDEMNLNKWISVDEAYDQLQKLNSNYHSVDNYQTANLKSRLLKNNLYLN